jgi:hypothetical protein
MASRKRSRIARRFRIRLRVCPVRIGHGPIVRMASNITPRSSVASRPEQPPELAASASLTSKEGEKKSIFSLHHLYHSTFQTTMTRVDAGKLHHLSYKNFDLKKKTEKRFAYINSIQSFFSLSLRTFAVKYVVFLCSALVFECVCFVCLH